MKNYDIYRIADKVKALSQEHNADEYEVYVSETTKLSLSIDNNMKIEKLQTDEEIALALRLIKNQRSGFSFSYSMSDSAIEETFNRALDTGSIMNKQPFSFVENRQDTIPSDKFYDPAVETLPEHKKIELLNRMIHVALTDKRIKKVDRPTYEEVISHVSIANSRGILKSYKVTRFNISLSVLAKEHEETQMSWNFQAANTFSHLTPEVVARNCAQQAIQTLGGIQLLTGFYDVLLIPFVVSQFLSILGNAFKADAIYKKTSMLTDKLGQKAFAEHLNIYDDPGLIDGSGSVPFDAEGVPAFKKTLVEKGMVKSFLYDRNYAILMGKETTGNAVRPSIMRSPVISTTNLVLDSDRSSEKDLNNVLSEGPVITELMGLHTVNPVTGDFSLGSRGYIIKSGRFSSPCKHITVSGNIFDLFNKIELAGRDHTLYGNILAPSLLVRALKISGDI
ncbi:MAG: TldD/PmbA family protein [bacterium]